jgi:hypothetical protein
VIFSIGLILCQYHYQSNAEDQQLTTCSSTRSSKHLFLAQQHITYLPYLCYLDICPAPPCMNTTYTIRHSRVVHRTLYNASYAIRRSHVALCENMSSKVDQTSWTWLLNNDERNDGQQFYVLPTFQVNDIALDHTGMIYVWGLPMMCGRVVRTEAVTQHSSLWYCHVRRNRPRRLGSQAIPEPEHSNL